MKSRTRAQIPDVRSERISKFLTSITNSDNGVPLLMLIRLLARDFLFTEEYKSNENRSMGEEQAQQSAYAAIVTKHIKNAVLNGDIAVISTKPDGNIFYEMKRIFKWCNSDLDFSAFEEKELLQITINIHQAADWINAMDYIDPEWIWKEPEEKMSSEYIKMQNRLRGIEIENVKLKAALNDSNKQITSMRVELQEKENCFAVTNPSKIFKIAVDVANRYWGNNWDETDSDSKPKQRQIVEWIKNKYPELTGEETRAIERVACPIERRRITKA